jgi:hypothetical protein
LRRISTVRGIITKRSPERRKRKGGRLASGEELKSTTSRDEQEQKHEEPREPTLGGRVRNFNFES